MQPAGFSNLSVFFGVMGFCFEGGLASLRGRLRWRAGLAVIVGLALSTVAFAATDVAALRKRVADGDSEAMQALGQAYTNGDGVAQDFAAALQLYRQSAERGLPAAWFSLGMVHELGQGVPANLEEAFKFYLKAAERGYAAAQFNVGNMYANGAGVPQNLFEAAVWFRQAAEAGVPEAQFNLGLAYELGRGLRQDEGLALRWYRRSATKGNARAQYNLALMLEQGRGAPADMVEAMTLYRLAAAQNFAPAQNNLGIVLAEGRGVPVNFVEAFAWLSVAADNGVTSEVLGLVAQQLSPVGKEEAQAALDLLRIRLGRRTAPTVRPPEAAAVTAAEPRPTVPNDAMAREVAGLRERLRETVAELERVRVENFRLTDPARSGAAPAAAVTAAQREVAALKEQVAKSAAELERSRADTVRASELLRETERTRGELERRLASAEKAARSAVISTSASEAAGSTLVESNLDVDKLAALYPRVATLVADNTRLREDLKQTTLEIASLNAQLRILQSQGGGAAATAAPAKTDPDAELTRRIVILRRTIDKLAEESRRNADLAAEFYELKQENDRLRAASPAVP